MGVTTSVSTGSPCPHRPTDVIVGPKPGGSPHRPDLPRLGRPVSAQVSHAARPTRPLSENWFYTSCRTRWVLRLHLVLQTVYVEMGLGRAGGSATPTKCVETEFRFASMTAGAVLQLDGRRRHGQAVVRFRRRAVAPHGGELLDEERRVPGADDRRTHADQDPRSP